MEMSEKICPYCFTEIDYRASVCLNCGKDVGDPDKDGIAKKKMGYTEICLTVITIILVFIFITFLWTALKEGAGQYLNK